MSNAHVNQIVQNLMTEVDSLKKKVKLLEKQNEALLRHNKSTASSTASASPCEDGAKPRQVVTSPPTTSAGEATSAGGGDSPSLDRSYSRQSSVDPGGLVFVDSSAGFSGGGACDRGLVSSLRRQILQLERRDAAWKEQVVSLERQLELLRSERESERAEHELVVAGLNHTIEGMAKLGDPNTPLQLKTQAPSPEREKIQLTSKSPTLVCSSPATATGPKSPQSPPLAAGSAEDGVADHDITRLRKRVASVVLKTRSDANNQSRLVAELPKEAVEQFGPVVLETTTSFHHKTASMGVPAGPVTNPNQLGEAINAEVKDRQWYTAAVIQRALRKVVKDLGTSSAFVGSGEASSAARMTLEANSAMPTVRGKSKDQLQLMVKENLSLYFYLDNNAPVLAERDPGTLPPLNKTNSDPILLNAFSSVGTTGNHEGAGVAGGSSGGGFSNPKQLASSAATSTMLSLSSYRYDQVEVIFHSPVLFSQIRQFLQFDFDLFVRSVDLCAWRESSSPGKSDAVMYYFGHFVLKSVKETEYRFLKDKFLGEYAKYTETNPFTLLTRFYCLFSFSWLKRGVKRRFVLMRNVFFTKQYINTIFDLKGSTIGRDGKTEDESSRKRTAFGALLLKDNDLPPQLIICGPLRRAVLLAQVRSDTSLLNSLSVVDYSCLIGMRSRIFTKDHPGVTHHGQVDADLTGNSTDAVCLFSHDGGLLSLLIYAENDAHTVREDVYYIGIIDILQTYTPQKRIENFAKGLLMDKHLISVVPPDEFSERLCKLIERISV